MAVKLDTLGITAAAVAIATAMYFVHIAHPSVYRRLDTIKSLLSDALCREYKVLIDGDSFLSTYSYQNSPYIQAVVIGTRTRGQKRLAIFGSAMLMILYTLFGLLVIISYGAGDSSFIIAAVGMIFTILSCFKKEAGGATVYFNAAEENWDRIEVTIIWPGELISQVINSWLVVWSSALSIINEGEGRRKEKKPGMSAFIVLYLCRMKRHVPVVEIQFAQAVSEKDADILQFDVGKVARKFANDIAKELGKKWTASADVYYDFAIAGKHGGLVYGRMRTG
ncbi:hypothetical protein V1515DRAFT_614520 [Lipomyces mesembrius]